MAHFVWRARVVLGADLARSRPVVRGCRGASRPSGKKKSVATQLARISVETFGLRADSPPFRGKSAPGSSRTAGKADTGARNT